MLDEKQVQKILNDLVFNEDIFKEGDIYQKSTKNFNRISDTFSDKYNKYLDLARPRQSAGQKKYRKDFFENVGNPVSVFVDRICNKFSIVFHNKEFGVDFEDEEVKKKVDETGFVKWFTANIFRMFTLSPNGCIYLKNFSDGKNETVLFDYASPENVLFFNDEYALIKTNEGYLLYSKKYNYQLTKNSKNEIAYKASDYKILRYENLTKSLNAYKIGLNVTQIDSKGQHLYSGLIDKSLPHLRMSQFHWLDYATNCAYGVNNLLWLTGNKSCGKCRGKGSYMDKQISRECDVCLGKGADVEMFSGGADEVMILPMQVSGELNGSDNNKSVSIPSNVGGLIKGDPEPAKVYSELYVTEMERAFFAISMETILRQTTIGSARQKEIEREELNQMLKVMSGIVCDLLQKILDDITKQMFGFTNNLKTPNVAYPSEFNFETEADLLDRIESVSKTDISDIYLANLKTSLVEKQSGADSIDLKRQLLINQVDPLIGKSHLARALALPTMEWWQNVLSNQVLSFVFKAEREHQDFWMKDLIAQIEILENYAKTIAELTTVNLDRQYAIKQQVQVNDSNFNN